MKLVDADVIWVPINKLQHGRAEPRLSAGQKTPLGLAANQGRQMDAGQKPWGNGRNQYVQEPGQAPASHVHPVQYPRGTGRDCRAQTRTRLRTIGRI
jgi:hypothetical protein